MGKHYEPAPEYAGVYRAAGWRGVAFYVLGWTTAPDEETDWTGIEPRTGQLSIVMVGDDAVHLCQPEDLTPLGELDYCFECGQLGCTADGRDREGAPA